MAKILHIIQQLSRGGGARATVYLAHYSQRYSEHEHTILSLLEPDPNAVTIAREYGVNTVWGLTFSEIRDAVRLADIVQVSFWNNTEVYEFLRAIHVPCRLVGWFHVGGQSSPQVITPKLADFFDLSLACSPYTLQCPALQERASRSGHSEPHRVGLVYGATDFGRIRVEPRRADGLFRVGYIGTLDFLKMHRNFVGMSAAVRVPNARIVVCGAGGAVPVLQHEAAERGISERFEFRGYVEDVSAEISQFDVYGYPLCPETYAASEMNLQEVMYAGKPAVVFPYGGVRELVRHNETALVVHSEAEYTQAIEYLYHNPDERVRIGKNARAYAMSVFGAHNAGLEANQAYERLLTHQKTLKRWDPPEALVRSGERRVGIETEIIEKKGRGHYWFIESLGDEGRVFLDSVKELDPSKVLRLDGEIKKSSEVLRMSGITPYKNAYPQDSWLQLWDGLAHWGVGHYEQALLSFVASVQLNPMNWRASWYLIQVCDALGQRDLAKQAREAFQGCLTSLPRSLSEEVRVVTEKV